ALLVAFGGTALAAGDPWTSVGAAGTVKETDLDKVELSGGIASIKSTAPAASTVRLFYNVTTAPDLADGGVNKRLRIRFRDNGPNARVRVFLRSYNLSNGTSQLLLQFDSDTLPASPLYRETTVGDGCFTGDSHFDFSANAYYLEVEVSRTSSAGQP